MKKETIDKVDVQILNILSNAPAMPNNEIAKRINLSPSTTLERVRKIKKSGIIRRQFSLLNYNLLNYVHQVVIRLEVPKNSLVDIYFELQQRHVIAVYSYESPYAYCYYVDAIGVFRTEASIKKLCDKITYGVYGIKVIGVYNILKLDKLAPMHLQKDDTLR